MIKSVKGNIEIDGLPKENLADLSILVAALVKATGSNGLVLESCLLGIYQEQIMASGDPVREMANIHNRLIKEGYMTEEMEL